MAAATRAWHDVCSLAELEERGWAVARVAGREIGVVRDAASGEVYGVRNRCPHHGAPLCRGATERRPESDEPGVWEISDRVVLRCPWHGWEFDLADGSCPDEPTLRVATYAVRVADGRVLVEA